MRFADHVRVLSLIFFGIVGAASCTAQDPADSARGAIGAIPTVFDDETLYRRGTLAFSQEVVRAIATAPVDSGESVRIAQFVGGRLTTEEGRDDGCTLTLRGARWSYGRGGAALFTEGALLPAVVSQAFDARYPGPHVSFAFWAGTATTTQAVGELTCRASLTVTGDDLVASVGGHIRLQGFTRRDERLVPFELLSQDRGWHYGKIVYETPFAFRQALRQLPKTSEIDKGDGVTVVETRRLEIDADPQRPLSCAIEGRYEASGRSPGYDLGSTEAEWQYPTRGNLTMLVSYDQRGTTLFGTLVDDANRSSWSYTCTLPLTIAQVSYAELRASLAGALNF